MILGTTSKTFKNKKCNKHFREFYIFDNIAAY